jgi:ABC-type Fe3+-hydroxamate transport system substrate-binding protein
MKADFLADEKWTMLSAVQQKNVVVLPFKANLNRVTVDDMLDLTASALLENKQ